MICARETRNRLTEAERDASMRQPPGDPAPAQILEQAAALRTGRSSSSPTHRHGSRIGVYREAVEGRLELHYKTLRSILSSIASRADPPMAEDLAKALEWLVEDQEAVMRDLFSRIEHNPAHGTPRMERVTSAEPL